MSMPCLAPTAPPLPTGDDQHVAADLDVRLRTPTTLVVSAQLEFTHAPAAPAAHPVELALVIPRAHCRGERPHLIALQHAAQAAVARATRGQPLPHPSRVLTPVGGQLHLVAQFGEP